MDSIEELFICRKMIREYGDKILLMVLHMRLGEINELDFHTKLNQFEREVVSKLNDIDRTLINNEKILQKQAETMYDTS